MGKLQVLWILCEFGWIIYEPYMSDDLNLGWLIHYVSGHRMPKPCKAMGNLKSDTLSLMHHMILWIVIWICLISITAAHPKYYHVLLLSSKYSKRGHKVLQRITSSHYQELQRTVWTCCSLRPASLRSGVRRSDSKSDTKRYPKRYPNLACVTPRPHSRAPKQQRQQQQQHWAHLSRVNSSATTEERH